MPVSVQATTKVGPTGLEFELLQGDPHRVIVALAKVSKL